MTFLKHSWYCLFQNKTKHTRVYNSPDDITVKGKQISNTSDCVQTSAQTEKRDRALDPKLLTEVTLS